jgi:hypothetical protein
VQQGQDSDASFYPRQPFILATFKAALIGQTESPPKHCHPYFAFPLDLDMKLHLTM